MKLKITIDYIRLSSNLTTNKTIKYTKKASFHTILEFTQSHSGPLGVIEGFIQKTPGTYKSEKPINVTGFDKIHLKADCVDGSTLDGLRHSILKSFGLGKPPGQKI